MIDSNGEIVADNITGTAYSDYIGEVSQPWSYLKSTYYKPMGYPDGIYRVGPLARLNACEMRHDAGRRRVGGVPRTGTPDDLVSFYYHYARLD